MSPELVGGKDKFPGSAFGDDFSKERNELCAGVWRQLFFDGVLPHLRMLPKR
jgi:hypothetical protein